MVTMRLPLIPALQMAIMARTGFRVVYSLEPDLGIAGRTIFMGTSIIVSTIARVTVGACQRAVSVQRSTVQNSTGRRCMTHTAMRLPADAGK